MPSLQLNLSNSNCTSDGSNGWNFQFAGQDLNIGRNACAVLNKITFSQSIFNISAALNNNSFTIVDTSSSTPRNISCVLNDGIYDEISLPAALNSLLQSGGLFTLSNGNPVYYMTLTFVNTSRRWLLSSYPTPTSYPSGSNPNNLGTSGAVPQIILPGGIAAILGYPAGTYPSTTTSVPYQTYSTVTPVQPITSVDICLDVVSADSRYVKVPQSLLCVLLDPNNDYGSVVSVEPFKPSSRPCLSVSRQSLLLTFLDQQQRRISFANPLFVCDLTLIWD